VARVVCKVRVKPEESEWRCVDLDTGVEIRMLKVMPWGETQKWIDTLRRAGFEVTVEPG
jgi:hypothetical protein